MGVYIEALILYMVLFLSYSVGQAPVEEIVVFSPAGELARIILYSVPSLALIWYLLLKSKSLKDWGIGPPDRKDLFVGLLALPALMLIGFAIALISHYLSQAPLISGITAPATIPAWIILIFSCLSTGYLEESFFRFYLIARREEFGLSASRAILLSTLLFSLCHLYEGPWGFLNAVLSGIVLSFIFLRYRSFHAIALAHGLYNIFVYAFDALQLT
jgi:membrane protease YdiL (CAAX protease family)